LTLVALMGAAVRIAADGRAVGDGLAGGEDAEGMPAVAA
jgi:hypothetical protein